MTSMKGFADVWVSEKKPSTAPATQLAYEKTVAAFLNHLGTKRAEADIADVSRRDIVAFRDSLYGRKLAPDTVNRYIKILRMQFKAAHRDRFVLENPVEHVEPVKYASKYPAPAIYHRGDSSGSCRGGSRMAKLDQIRPLFRPAARRPRLVNVGQRRPYSRRASIVTRKTGKRLTIPLAQPLREHIESLPASDSPEAPLHPRAFEAVNNKGRAVSVSNAFVGLLAQAGLRERHSHEECGIGPDAKR
jgi:hypothetical protein